jgi:hypothetical protein
MLALPLFTLSGVLARLRRALGTAWRLRRHVIRLRALVLKIIFEYEGAFDPICSKTHFHGESIEDVTDYRTKRID